MVEEHISGKIKRIDKQNDESLIPKNPNIKKSDEFEEMVKCEKK